MKSKQKDLQKKLKLIDGLIRGEKAIQKGNIVSHAEAKKRLKRWLD